MPAVHIHPFIVHFTIALFSASVLFDFIALLRRNEKLHFVGWWNLLLAGISVVFAVGSGLWTKSQVVIPASAETTLDTHQTIALVVAGFILGLLFWRIGLRGGFPHRQKFIYGLVALIAVIFLFSGSYYGGKLVFEKGVGVEIQTRQDTEPLPQKQENPKQRPGDEFMPEKK